VKQLTDNDRDNFSPAWSPDGHRIVFDSVLKQEEEIFIIDADGSNETQLTLNDLFDAHPAWSPDGSRIAFESMRSGDFSTDIFVMDADGGNETRLTTEGVIDFAWSPDGSRFLFSSDRDEDREIFVMDADGSNLTQLTFKGGDDPAWCPIYSTPSETGNRVTPESPERLLVIVDALHMRNNPNTTIGDKLGLLKKGDVVEVLQRRENWVKVRTEAGLVGWACVELDDETFLAPVE
jgi:Tol biopolymer transport system component